MKEIVYFFLLFLIIPEIHAQKPEETEDWSKAPLNIIPGKKTRPPSDAIILYGGKKDLGKWTDEKGGPVSWNAGKVLTIVPKTGSIQTVITFSDVQLHIEWRTPKKISGSGQGRGNSGVFLMGKYEVQVLDSYNNETYYNGQAGSIYKQHIPFVNASLGPGKWQGYDIFFTAPVFDADQSLKTPAYITVIHNGVIVQNHAELKGPTVFIGKPKYTVHPGKLPLKLQDHNNPVSFRNIWIREL